MGDKDFMLAGDGWVQVTPCGDFPHVGAGVMQVIDREACDRIAADFNGHKSDPNYPGVLVDFDHFSLDTEKSSEAAGWISDLESRDTGLWARVRWSDAGLSAVQGGRFRLMSPVFPPPSACEDLGGGKIRPVMLVSVALTNEPNIKGGKPIANRMPDDAGLENRETAGDGPGANEGKGPVGKQNPGDVLSGPGAKKFMWLLGNPPKGPHCGECVSRNGQVKTLLEWLRMPAPQCHCYCSLAEVGVDVPEGYDPTAVTLNLGNRWKYGWGDVARAASLAVRRAKAAARKADEAFNEFLTGGIVAGKPAKEPGDKEKKVVCYTCGQAGHYASKCPQRDTRKPKKRAPHVNGADAAPVENRDWRVFRLVNRVEQEVCGRLANVGWTDEARASALAVRRMKAEDRVKAAGGIPASGAEVGATSGVNGSSSTSIRAPSPPTEGTLVNVGGGISVMMNGKLVRIGSAKVLCVLPDGQLGVKLNGKAYPIGTPEKWRLGFGGPKIVKVNGKFMLDVGKGYLDLDTGQVKTKPAPSDSKGSGKTKVTVITRNPFAVDGVDIPPAPPDNAQRRYIQA